ncbi:hypothetical protein [Microtetraspora malaysiensis]|uniref:hypothetical protein n=1 Tax=Microtetraspora malaysiensis TaxID=161358 RepID=UPI003D92097A
MGHRIRRAGNTGTTDPKDVTLYKKALATAASAVLTLSLIPAAHAAAAPDIQIVPGYSATMKEKDSKFMCPSHEVLIGRAHDGDENGWTTYWCGRIYIDNVQVTVSSNRYTQSQAEPWSAFESPESNAMIGRDHAGDENGWTSTHYALLTWLGTPVTLTTRRWTSRFRESKHESKAGTGEIMTGRRHLSDENGDTMYQYATVSF